MGDVITLFEDENLENGLHNDIMELIFSEKNDEMMICSIVGILEMVKREILDMVEDA
jgi:hypothetical protein